MLSSQPNAAFECLKRCIGNTLQWVEDIHIDESREDVLEILITHSYPDGIDVVKFAIPVIERHMPPGHTFVILSKTVSSGSGAMRSSRVENKRMTQ